MKYGLSENEVTVYLLIDVAKEFVRVWHDGTIEIPSQHHSDNGFVPKCDIAKSESEKQPFQLHRNRGKSPTIGSNITSNVLHIYSWHSENCTRNTSQDANSGMWTLPSEDCTGQSTLSLGGA